MKNGVKLSIAIYVLGTLFIAAMWYVAIAYQLYELIGLATIGLTGWLLFTGIMIVDRYKDKIEAWLEKE